MLEEEYLTFWYDAAKLEFGLCIPLRTRDIENVRHKLYQAKADAGDPRIAHLSIHVPKSADCIWIHSNAQAKLD